jgi:hypothetical protein
MANQLLSRASPAQDYSVARRVMDDAVAFYLANGGPAVARAHLDYLAHELLKFYDDAPDAYREAMARIAAAEKLLLQQAEERNQQQLQQLVMTMMGVLQSTPAPHQETAPLCDTVELPPKLCTDQAMLLWQRLQQAGYIDEHYQPCGLSRTKSAVLADEMMNLLSNENERLTGSDDKWKPYETLWHRSNMKADHYRALNQVRISEFRAEIRKLLNGQR